MSWFHHFECSMADRDLRKAELERKKAKLAEMRKEKQRKEVNIKKSNCFFSKKILSFLNFC